MPSSYSPGSRHPDPRGFSKLDHPAHRCLDLRFATLAELPHLEKLYEKVKDRKDIQILTFDLDGDLGVVAPYLNEKGYTFPVLPAFSTVVNLLDGFAIPQTWLVDPHGVWQSKQIGFSGGSDVDFEKEMLQRLNSAKAGQ